MDNRSIGMFDSGIGGMTVLKEIKKKLPNENIIYFGDTIHFPYGSRSKESIIELTKKGLDFLVKQNVKLIIVACGTATSQALDILIPDYNIPVIGIIDPTVEYIKSKPNIHRIGIVATSGTIKSNSWGKHLLQSNPELIITNKACPLLATMAEEGWTDNEIANLTVNEYIKDIGNIDALILGCTHYPLFSKLFKFYLNSNVELINTGIIIANYVSKLLVLNNLFSNNNGNINIYLTDTEPNFINVASYLLGYKIKNISIVKDIY
jgi:glutamate racemase